jgi:hypothetical protein
MATMIREIAEEAESRQDVASAELPGPPGETRCTVASAPGDTVH